MREKVLFTGISGKFTVMRKKKKKNSETIILRLVHDKFIYDIFQKNNIHYRTILYVDRDRAFFFDFFHK